MSLDLDLLWKAWPSGYLAMRGVRTVGGWMCQQVEPELLFTKNNPVEKYRYPQVDWISIHPADGKRDIRCSLAHFSYLSGDLLPMVNPGDHASWGCLLADLVTAASGVSADAGVDVIWEQRNKSHTGSSWSLTWRTGDGFQGCTYFDFPDEVEDKALALVLALVSIRK